MIKKLAFFSVLLFSSLSSSAQIPVNIYDSTIVERLAPFVVVKELEIKGNKVTKPHIITRELAFKMDDTIPTAQLHTLIQKSRQNLLNTALFNFVNIVPTKLDSFSVKFEIEVLERWYFFPLPIFELADRNFNIWWETKDFSRTNYGFYLVKENFRGRKERLRFIIRLGYTFHYAFAYDIPYISRNQRSGLSFYSGYATNKEIGYRAINNRLLFFRDEQVLRKEFSSRIRYSYRKGIYNTHSVEARYNQASIADTVLSLNADYFKPFSTQIKFFSVSYNFRRDYRNSRAYPLTGYFFEADLSRYGLGILKEENVNFYKVEAVYRNYEKLSKKFYLATGIKGKTISESDQPYFLTTGLGYGSFVRGYEYYVIDGQSYALGQVGIKYEIVKPQKAKIPFVPGERFNTIHYALYGEIFSDAAYVSDEKFFHLNPLSNSLIYGYGVGLNYVTYYDKVLRLEYSYNKLKESGIFIHFSAPI